MDDGWTLVTTKSKKDGTLEWSKPPVVKGLTVERMVLEYEQMRQTWLKSECRKTLLNVLQSARPDGGWKVSVAIALALGGLSVDYDIQIRQRSLWQLIAFVDIVDQHMDSHEPIKRYAQEPRFNAQDGQFLYALGVTVLEHPHAEEYMTSAYFTYVPFLEWEGEVRICLEGKDPTLHMGSRIDWIIEQAELDISAFTGPGKFNSGMREESCHSVKVAQRFKDYHHHAYFPNFEVDDGPFYSFSIYWKKDVDEEEGE